MSSLILVTILSLLYGFPIYVDGRLTSKLFLSRPNKSAASTMRIISVRYRNQCALICSTDEACALWSLDSSGSVCSLCGADASSGVVLTQTGSIDSYVKGINPIR